MRSPARPFMLALALYTLGGALAMLFASEDDSSASGTVAGAAAAGLAMTAVLWFFAARNHRWPKWFLLALLVLGIGAQVASLDARSTLAILDVAALVVLLRGWSRIERPDYDPTHQG